MTTELLLETIGRNLIVIAWLVVGLRIMGKRQLGQFNVYDLAMIMAVSNAVQNAMTKGSGLLGVGLVSAATLLISGRIAARLFLRYPGLEAQVAGTPTLLLEDGHLLREHMRREHVSEDQVVAALREHGLAVPGQAKMVVLEVDGTLSVVPADQPSHRTKKKLRRLQTP